MYAQIQCCSFFSSFFSNMASKVKLNVFRSYWHFCVSFFLLWMFIFIISHVLNHSLSLSLILPHRLHVYSSRLFLCQSICQFVSQVSRSVLLFIFIFFKFISPCYHRYSLFRSVILLSSFSLSLSLDLFQSPTVCWFINQFHLLFFFENTIFLSNLTFIRNLH